MRGAKPSEKIKIAWSSNFAYAIGLLVTDGCLLSNKKQIDFTSKDKELVDNFQKSLNIKCHVRKKSSGSQSLKKYFNLQIGDVKFCEFLMDIGIMPKKSKIIKEVKVPKEFFPDFLRGHFDGDGSFYSYWDPRWKASYMFYTAFVSASKNHILWIQDVIKNLCSAKGHITKAKKSSCYQLKYAKNESLMVLRKIYYNKNVVCLSRKRLKIEAALGIMVEKL